MSGLLWRESAFCHYSGLYLFGYILKNFVWQRWRTGNFYNLPKMVKTGKITLNWRIMTTKQFVILMLIVTVVCGGAFLTVLFFINPETTGPTGFFLFYLSLFFGLTGLLSLLGFYSRYLFTRKFQEFEQAQISFRQAIFFGIIIASSLLLQSQQLLTWVNAVILVFLLTIIEFLIVSLRKSH